MNIDENTFPKKMQKKKISSFVIARNIITIIFSIYVATLLLPMAWGVIVSLTSKRDFILNGFSKLPTKLMFVNYINAFRDLNTETYSFFDMFTNSFWYAVGSSLLTVLISSMTAYAAAKYKFLGGKIIYMAAIISMIVPVVNNLPSLIKFSVAVGIYDSPLMLLSQMSGAGFNFIVLYSFFKNVSSEYSEAAFIDGAGHFRTFLTINFPFAISPMIALSLAAFNGYWADAMFPLLFIPSYPTIASGLLNYQLDVERIPGAVPVLYAGLLISTLPVIALFIAFQKKFMDLQISGGLKG